jgi:hypothetical protein
MIYQLVFEMKKPCALFAAKTKILNIGKGKVVAVLN